MSAVLPKEVSPAPTAATLLQVIQSAAQNPAVDIEKMERLLAMHERILARDAEAEFNEAMRACQSEMRRISADATNPQTKSQYASYPALDRVLRPIYTSHGFSLSFSDGETAKVEYVRVVCLVRHRAGHKELHWKDMPADGKGAKGGDVMTKTHATGAAQQYGMRYLLKGIFNVAIGDQDNDGNTDGMPDTEVAAWIMKIEATTEKSAAKEIWHEAVKVAEGYRDTYAAKKIKDALVAHGAFIDKAGK
jgi:hypothetical protein